MKKVAHNLIIVEGNISAGKTTLSQALAKQLNMRLWSEPVAENPYLEKFYAEYVSIMPTQSIMYLLSRLHACISVRVAYPFTALKPHPLSSKSQALRP